MKTIIRILFLGFLSLIIPSCGEDDVEITGMSLYEDYISIRVGQSYFVDIEVSPPEADPTSLIWTVIDEEIVSVSNGVVTGISAGVATIKISNKSASVRRNLRVRVIAQTTSLDTYVSYKQANTNTYNYTDIRNNDKKYTFYTDQQILLKTEIYPRNTQSNYFKYETSDPSVINFGGEGELIIPGTRSAGCSIEKPGSCRITVTAIEDGSGISSYWDITVLNILEGIYINPSYVTMLAATTKHIEVFPIPSDATLEHLTWKVSDPSIADIYKDGTIVAKKAGNTTIIASSNGKSAACYLTVLPSGVDNGHEGFIEEEW